MFDDSVDALPDARLRFFWYGVKRNKLFDSSGHRLVLYGKRSFVVEGKSITFQNEIWEFN